MKEIFESSEPLEKRAFLNFLLQNPSVHGKKLEFTLRKPFNLILELATCPIGLAIKSDFANCDWVKVYPSPTVVQKQMRELLIAAGHKDPLYPKPLDAASPLYR